MREGHLDEAPIWSDIRTFDGRPWRGKVAGIVGGYPCQPFSSAGARLGTNDPRHLWPHIERIIGETGPDWCFFENVSGHVSLGYFDVVRPALENFGFRVAEALIEAADVGAPHKRQRLFILAAKPGALADAECEGRGQERTGSQVDTGRESEPGRGALVHTDLEVRGVHGAELPHVGDPISQGLQGRLQRGVSGPEEREGPLRRASEPGSVLADAVGERGCCGEAWCSDAAHAGPPGGGLAEFPPGPGDIEAWRDVLERFPLLAPALEPELCGMAHGPAPGVDIPQSAKLQLLGNAVVPQQAAIAFKLLERVITEGA